MNCFIFYMSKGTENQLLVATYFENKSNQPNFLTKILTELLYITQNNINKIINVKQYQKSATHEKTTPY